MKIEKVKLGPVLALTMGSLLYPQVVLMMFVPLMVSFLAVIFGLWLTWGFWLSYMTSGALAFQPYWIWLHENSPEFLHSVFNFFSVAAPWVLLIVLLALSFPFIVVLNLLIVSVLASTYLVKFIARRNYPDVRALGSSRFLRGLGNTVSTGALFLFFWLISLPLWLIPGAAFVIPLLLTAWLNRRICNFDALTDFATEEELRVIPEVNSTPGFVLGLLTAVLNYIPLAFLISPVLTMVGFIHLNLQALQTARKGQS